MTTTSNRAKVLTDEQLDRVLAHVAQTSKDPLRDYVIVLLSFKAGLRSCEIAGLRKVDITDVDGRLANLVTVPANIAKNGKGRSVPMHRSLHTALEALLARHPYGPRETLIRGLPRPGETEGVPFLMPNSITQFLRRLYRECGLVGASSHSGRRTFLTRAAQMAGMHGCSLRDVQLLAGHASITTTEIYVEPSERQAELVECL